MDTIRHMILGMYMLAAYALGAITGGAYAHKEAQKLYMQKVGYFFEGRHKKFTTGYANE